MPWYTRAINRVDPRNCEEAETARMWRQIDPVSTDFSHAVSYLEVEQVNKAVDLLAELKEVLQDTCSVRTAG